MSKHNTQWLDGYASREELESLNAQIARVAAMLSGMRRKLLGENLLTR